MSADRRRELTRELEAVLDARGLFVHVDAIPVDPDSVDESSGQRRYQLFPVRVPEVAVVKAGRPVGFFSTNAGRGAGAV